MLTIPAASFSLLLLASLMMPSGARAASRPLRIVTINLLHGGMTSELAGRDQHLEERLTMVVRELRTLGADVVGVQEASRGRRRGDVAARLASALGFHHVYAQAAPRWPLVSRVLGLEEGPAVLSRFPIVTSHAYPIDGCGGLYRRGLVCAELATPRGPLEACSTHLDGSDCHAERVASILGARPRTAPLLLMGDLNATEQSKGIRNLIAALGLVDTFREANPAAPGFTVWQPVWLERPFASRRVDFILLAPGANTRGRVVASRVVLNQPSRTQGRVLWPSDHYGVLSEVEILRRAGDGRQGGRSGASADWWRRLVPRPSDFARRRPRGMRSRSEDGSTSLSPARPAPPRPRPPPTRTPRLTASPRSRMGAISGSVSPPFSACRPAPAPSRTSAPCSRASRIGPARGVETLPRLP